MAGSDRSGVRSEAHHGPFARDLVTLLDSDAARRARTRGGLVCAVRELPAALDPALAVARLRQPGERWFAFEVPDRAGFAVAGTGVVRRVRSVGPGRFAAAAGRWREAVADAAVAHGDGGGALPLAVPVAVGGFAFADSGPTTPQWDGFGALDFVFPEVAIVREGGRSWLVLQVASDAAVVRARADAVARLLDARLSAPLLDPDPLSRPRITSVLAPEHFEEAVRRATALLRAGEAEKVVLARAVRVDTRSAIDPLALYCALREVFPACYTYLVGAADASFVGATPELLVRRDGLRVQTVALAGTARRSADPAVDRHLGEQLARDPKQRREHEIVARRIARNLEPLAVWVTVAAEPQLVRVHNVQHLATPIRAQLREPVTLFELAERLHPTPAIGGEPRAAAARLVPALEGIDRGWYAGGIGWIDRDGGGELAVALRCALVRGTSAELYAGCGIVAESDPAAELAETEAKLTAVLPLFG